MKISAFSPHDGIYINHIKTQQKHNMSVQHYHDAYEIYLHLGGTRYLFCDNYCYTLKRGDLLIFEPFDLHYAESREADFYERYVANFKAADLAAVLDESERAYLTSKLQSCIIELDEEQTQTLCRAFERCEGFVGKDGFLERKLLCAALTELVWRVSKLGDGKESIKGAPPESCVHAAVRYINRNYESDLSLDGLCAELNISKFYFCHSFKRHTGATVMEYVNNVRLIKVHSLLLNTKLRVEEIAKLTGFGNGTNLNRAFKKVYGVSPREFRKSGGGAV